MSLVKCALLFITTSLFSHSIVFVHLGKTLPKYLPTALSQARLFNPECPIYLLANEAALHKPLPALSHHRITTVTAESLTLTPSHHYFKKHSKHNRVSLDGFWFYTTERFFYLEDLIQQHQLTDVVHLENDVMLYVDIATLLPTFHRHYTETIGATFEQDGRCVPGIIYIPNPKPLQTLNEFLASRAALAEQEMDVIGHFDRQYHTIYIDNLPTTTPKYASQNPLQSLQGAITTNPSAYYNHFDEFDSVFDAAALGQYLGGIDPIHFKTKPTDPTPDPIPGYISPASIFDVSQFTFTWEADLQGRQVPYLLYKGEKKRINNLHIHCKQLTKFHSLEKDCR